MVLVKAVDVLERGPQDLPGALWGLALGGWVAGGAALLAASLAVSRAGWWAVLGSGLALAVDFPVDLRRQHLVLLIGIALVGAVTGDDQERLLLWRLQLTALYAVAALSKLNESFLGGDALALAVVNGPAWTSPLPVVLAGLGLLATEVTLATLPWVPRLRRAGLVLAVAFHGATLVLVSEDALVGLRLLVFGSAAVALHVVSAGLVPVSRRTGDASSAPGRCAGPASGAARTP